MSAWTDDDDNSWSEDKLLAAASSTPRYLFGCWHKGNPRQAFYGDTAIEAPARKLSDHSVSDIRAVIDRGFEDDESARISFHVLTHSLPLCLAFAQGYIEEKKEEVMIGVVDVHLLGEKNPTSVAIGAVELCELMHRDCDKRKHLVLVYGAITRSASSVVKVTDIMLPDRAFFVEGVCRIKESKPAQRFLEALQVARLFGSQFAVPMAAHLMSIHRCDVEVQEEVVDWLLSMPELWSSDFLDIEVASTDYHGYVEARYAEMLLFMVAHHKNKPPVSQSATPQKRNYSRKVLQRAIPPKVYSWYITLTALAQDP